MQKLIIIRGQPGSGKSTLSRRIHKFADLLGLSCVHAEADQYFYLNNKESFYDFNPALLGKAHGYCFNKVETGMIDKTNLVIVSNTFIKRKDMVEYIKAAQLHGYDISVFRCTGDYKSIHDVPEAVVQRMKDQYQPNYFVDGVEHPDMLAQF